jgi:hypothetical protein
MKRFAVIIVSLLAMHRVYPCDNRELNTIARSCAVAQADWLVVGAGPAGIATVGILLDVGVEPHRITWLDPEFKVGRMGACYGKVPSNTMAKEFMAFVETCNAFKGCPAPSISALKDLDPYSHQELKVIIAPLQDITNHLRTKVKSIKGSMTGLTFTKNQWIVSTDATEPLHAHNVVLATGSHPTVLEHEQKKIIPLDSALNPDLLKDLIKPDDVVGVVGNSHSGILVLKFLSELTFELANIYLLARSPLCYAVNEQGQETNPLHGLKGPAADWARNILEKGKKPNITTISSSREALKKTLAKCTKVIYATGYQQNSLPLINNNKPIATAHAGELAPHLFGIGIAFPERVTDKNGNQGYCIGLSCFMDYAQRMIPQWVKE